MRPRLLIEAGDEELTRYAKSLVDLYPVGKFSPAARLVETRRMVEEIKRNPDFIEPEMHALLGKIGVLCLSDTSASSSMWSYYADDHCGVCFQFRSDRGLFVIAQRVTYVDKFPTVNRIRNTREEILQASMYTKHRQWEHEMEWRVIARFDVEGAKEGIESDTTIPDDLRRFYLEEDGPGYYTVPADALEAVILGDRISANDEAWIRGLASNRRVSCALHRAIVIPGTFDIGHERIM